MMMSYGSLLLMSAVMMVAVTAAPSTRPNSAALARVLVPVVRHRLEEGRALPPGLMEELVTDLEESEPHMRHLHDAAGKREFDEYGHMRFGKRTGVVEYDDYGHLRFGRSTDGGFDDEEQEKLEGRNGSSRFTRHTSAQNPIRSKKH